MPENITPEEIQTSFDAELTRLQARSLAPELETIARRYYSQKERESMDEGSFCGPHRSFPITNQADVSNAAHLIGHADNPDAVKACIKRKAKANGWSLPDSWQDDGDSSDKKEERTTSESGTLNAVMNATHELSFPIVRTDPKTRLVYGRATVEQPDKHGTIFSYEGAKEAFKRWKGNIREQHDPKKAVGKRVEYTHNDDEKGVYLTSRCSEGAPETWAKLLDGTLADYSVSVIPDPEYGLDPRKWPTVDYQGKPYPYLPRYTYAEISYVDSGSAPGADLVLLARADGTTTDVLAPLEEEAPAPVEQKHETQERAGARIGSATRAGLHAGRDGALNAATSIMQTCDCPECQEKLNRLNDDAGVDNDGTGGLAGFEQNALKITERMLQPVYARLQALAGEFARNNTNMPALERSITASIESSLTTQLTRSLETIEARLVKLSEVSSLDEVRATLVAVKDQVERIAAQPATGSPILNGAYPVDKRLATDPMPAGGVGMAERRSVIDELHRAGAFKTLDEQTAVVAQLLQPQRGVMG